MQAFRAWEDDRAAFIKRREAKTFQMDYVRGEALGRRVAQQHRTRLNLRSFEEDVAGPEDSLRLP